MAKSMSSPFWVSAAKGSRSVDVPKVSVSDFKYGILNYLEPQAIPEGAATDSLNWITVGSKIEIRRGYALFGKTRQTGTGRIGGIFTAHLWNGNEVYLRARGAHLEYYNTTLSPADWTEIGSSLLGTAAVNDDVSFAEYISQAGAQVWVSSPNGGLWKIMTANLGSPVNQYINGVNFEGYIKITLNRMFAWGMNKAKTILYQSKVDPQNAGYQLVTAEAIGNSGSKTYTGTLGFLSPQNVSISLASPAVVTFTNTFVGGESVQFSTAGTLPTGMVVGQTYYVLTAGLSGSQFEFSITPGGTPFSTVGGSQSGQASVTVIGRTAFGVSFTDGGTEVFTDNYMGGLTGSLGGSGTINYATGAYSISFNGTAAGNVTATYQWENSTVGGIADFTYSSTRTTGQGNFYLQDGGTLLNSHTYNQIEYQMHQRSVWNVITNVADSAVGWLSTPFRKNMASQNWRGSVATADGIYYVDTTVNSRPYFALIAYNQLGTQVLPTDLSSGSTDGKPKFDMTEFYFDQASMFEWDRYILCACRTLASSVNNRIILYNKDLDCFDVVDFYATCFSIANGALIAGDSATGNVFTVFSGFDDDQATPYSQWTSNIDFLKIVGQKTVKQIWIEGEIDPNQKMQVLAATDRGQFVLIGTVLGNGSYVDKGSNISIGQNTVGLNQVGGGGLQNSIITSNHYEIPIKISLGRFQQIQLQFITIGIGYVSISTFLYYDVWEKADKMPLKYR